MDQWDLHQGPGGPRGPPPGKSGAWGPPPGGPGGPGAPHGLLEVLHQKRQRYSQSVLVVLHYRGPILFAHYPMIVKYH